MLDRPIDEARLLRFGTDILASLEQIRLAADSISRILSPHQNKDNTDPYQKLPTDTDPEPARPTLRVILNSLEPTTRKSRPRKPKTIPSNEKVSEYNSACS